MTDSFSEIEKRLRAMAEAALAVRKKVGINRRSSGFYKGCAIGLLEGADAIRDALARKETP